MTDTMSSLHELLVEEPANVIDEISPRDNMYARSRRFYQRAGQMTLQSARLAMLTAGKAEIGSILDFGSGYGRTLRTFKAAFPDASLTASDINREAVDFCARVFGATPVYSSRDPADIEIEPGFDLIVCNSFFTHVDRDGWSRFLPFLESLLAPGGIFVFTTAGRRAAGRVRDEPHRLLLGWLREDEETRAGFLADWEREGFAHRDSPAFEGWGYTAATPAWVCSRLAVTSLRLLGVVEGKNVDTFSCLRPD
jgi:SAM-dependent methyltransferase